MDLLDWRRLHFRLSQVVAKVSLSMQTSTTTSSESGSLLAVIRSGEVLRRGSRSGRNLGKADADDQWKWVGSHRRKVSAATDCRYTETLGPAVDNESTISASSAAARPAGVRDVVVEGIDSQRSRDSSSTGELRAADISLVGVAAAPEPLSIDVASFTDHAEWPEIEIWRPTVLNHVLCQTTTFHFPSSASNRK